MHKGVLRKVGGSVVVALPPAILKQLDIAAQSTVAIAVSGSDILLRPQRRPRYSLAELLANCDQDAAWQLDEDWTSGAPEGRELL